MLLLFQLISLITLNHAVKLTRKLEGSGFHRGLLFEFSDISGFENVLVQQTIPSSAYIDQYELKSHGELSLVKFAIREDVDVEKPEFLSKPFDLRLYFNLTASEPVKSIRIPVHLRYHKSSETASQAAVHFPAPILYHKIRAVGSKPQMTWEELSYGDTSELHTAVPVGYSPHLTVVALGTCLSTFAFSIWLSIALFSPDPKSKFE